MNTERELLSLLLEKYENSRHIASSSNRRVMLKKSELTRFDSSFDSHVHLLKVLSCLEERGLVSVEYYPDSDKKLIDRVFLDLDGERIAESYRISGRSDLQKGLRDLSGLLSRWKGDNDTLNAFIFEMQEYISTRHRIPRYFSFDMALNEKILKELVFLFSNTDEILERVLSTRLFGDSKEAERMVRGPVVSILRHIASESGDEWAENDDEILSCYGLVRYPEIIEFCGDVRMVIRSSNFDYSSLSHGAYINSEDVKNIESISSSARRVLFIENKANYVSALSSRKDDELIVYHGGFYSPLKGLFFKKLYRALSQTCTFSHWSDIDLGGFRLFMRLKSEIVPTLQPHRMDKATLVDNLDMAMSIENRSYLSKLEKLYGDKAYEQFWPVIELMLEKKVRLEQEVLI